MKQPALERLIHFHRLLDQFAMVDRVVHIRRKNAITLESDTEHSYNLAMMAWFLADHFKELDRNRIIQLALVHDLVEVYAGDTFVFDTPEMLASKTDREAAAKERLAAEWTDFPSLDESIAEYETRETPEACFVYALDKIIPMFAVYLNEGYTWKDRKMSLEKLNEEKRRKMSVSPQVLPYWDELHSLLKQHPQMFPADFC